MLFRAPRCDDKEEEAIAQIDELRRSLRFQVSEPARWTGQLRRMSFARALQNSNSIEGINATLDDVLAVAGGEEPMDADRETSAALAGYRQAMTYVFQLASDPHFRYTDDLIKSLHFIMLQYDLAKVPGRWRPGYIYVRREPTGEIVYEGPDAERVPALIHELVETLNTDDDQPALVRAAMAHLNLVLIHPFKDGNGRMARCLQTLCLAREGILAPEFSSIEEYLGHNTDGYYAVLTEVARGYWQPKNDTRPWVRFCLTAHYRQVRTLLSRVRETMRLWHILESAAKENGLPDRTIVPMFDAAQGFRVRNITYRSSFEDEELSEQTAGRDLKAMVEKKLLISKGERRGRYYVASESLKAMRAGTLDVKVPIEDPFEDRFENATS